MKTSLLSFSAACLAFGLAGTAHADTDLGPSAASQNVTASLVLKVQDQAGLEQFVAGTADRDNWLYHQFLSTKGFVDRFAPSGRDIQRITDFLAANGITVTEVYTDHLLIKATGPVSAFDAVFSTEMHDFTDGKHRFRRPRHQPHVPTLFKDLLYVVEGLDESASFKSHRVNANTAVPFRQISPALPSGGVIATGVPGEFTVGDVANMYDINPVYARNIDGRGHTLGIATLAGFDPNDAYTYWSLIGLDTKPNRITQVHVDGGGVISSDAGTGETCLDVEQSGGLAPQANIVVYDAPNTEAGFIDLFYKAASDNIADSLSVSWGSSEVLRFAAVTGADETGDLLAFHQAFLEAAAQGMSLFASAGDDGALDLNGPGLANFLTVDSPASDPAIVAAGGTTVPASLDFEDGVPPLVVAQEQVWGWDYLVTYFASTFGIDITDEVFPVGTGGGVSVFWPVPDYQRHTQGVRRTEPNQSVVFDPGDGSGPQDLLDLPANFKGRNLPDVSLNADPETGYIIYSTTDGGLLAGFGGTSFVAPQLNGIATLMNQVAGGRLGLVNPMLYSAQRELGYRGPSPFVDITTGDNWFYAGSAGYEPGAGLGVLDVDKLAKLVAFEARR